MNAPAASSFMLIIRVLLFLHTALAVGLCLWATLRKKRPGSGNAVESEKAHDKLFEIVTRKGTISCELPPLFGYYVWFGYAALGLAVLIWRFWGD